MICLEQFPELPVVIGPGHAFDGILRNLSKLHQDMFDNATRVSFTNGIRLQCYEHLNYFGNVKGFFSHQYRLLSPPIIPLEYNTY